MTTCIRKMTAVGKGIGTIALMTFMACGLARAQYSIDDADAFTRQMHDMFKQAATSEDLEKAIAFCKSKVMFETVQERTAITRKIQDLIKQKKAVEVQEQLRLSREITQRGERLREIACTPG